MTTLEILIAARAKIENIENWCQNDFAIDEFGIAISANDVRAKCFCAFGACSAVRGGTIQAGEQLALNWGAYEMFRALGIADVNDGDFGIPPDTSPEEARRIAHANVLKVFDAAIAAETAA